ncbi:hypothetical protein CFI11_03090 [Thalassococcus sp. S3]|nr:hypothetical protein [Thalassococcus sp. S3]QBF30204.1 hypothetical protein CFI11_03090 [Thalassococcus sp. S3]
MATHVNNLVFAYQLSGIAPDGPAGILINGHIQASGTARADAFLAKRAPKAGDTGDIFGRDIRRDAATLSRPDAKLHIAPNDLGQIVVNLGSLVVTNRLNPVVIDTFGMVMAHLLIFVSLCVYVYFFLSVLIFEPEFVEALALVGVGAEG